jgi:hypothetical protein
MKSHNAYEEKEYRHTNSQIWKRKNYEHKYCNMLINLDYKKQYCILGVDTFYNKLEQLKILYEDKTNDFILLDNKEDSDKLCSILDEHHFSEMKCYSMTDCSEDELIKYFKLLYKSCDDYAILFDKSKNLVETENSTKVNVNTGGWNIFHL